MEIIYKENFGAREGEVIDAIKRGAIFVYPTDTIYGLGCDATNEVAVAKVRALKGRADTPLSVIAPSKPWILENCEIANENLLDRLPGPYTLIFELRNKNVVPPNINPKNDTLGVRIPAHWFTEVVAKAAVPFVTTSVNKYGGKFMKSLKDADPEIIERADFVIYEGEKKGLPSTVLDFSNPEAGMVVVR